MKHNVLLGLSSLFLLTGLAGCGCNAEVNADTIEKVRTFAALMGKDASGYNDLVYESSFMEKYSVSYVSEDDVESTAYSMQYHAEGDVLSGYCLKVNAGTVTPATIFSQGIGYFSGRQQETTKLSHVVTDKASQNKVKDTKADYALNHVFGVQFDGNELYASGKSEVTNNLVPANSEAGEFRGKIAKSALRQFGEDTIANTISRILYLGAWSTISSFKEATISYFQGLDLSTDDKAKQFVADKQVKVSENSESIQINFVLDGSKIVDGISGKETGVSAGVPGSAKIDKKTKFVTYCDFNFKDLFLALLQKGNVNKKSYSVSVDACSLKTVLTADSASNKKLEGTFPEYAASQRTEFVTKFKQYVIPSLEGVELEN